MHKQDLSLVTTDDLVREIGMRHRLVLCATLGVDEGCGADREATKIRVVQGQSSPWEVHGLASGIERYLRAHADEHVKRGLDL